MQAKEMSNEITSESSEFSKSVTKVQTLCHLGVWSEQPVLKDFLQCFFSKRTALLHRRKDLSARKRVVVLTPDDILLVYETNCTGYSFNVKAAGKLKMLCVPGIEKTCTVTLKYPFGSVNLVLLNQQISLWRRTLSAIFEGEPLDSSLRSQISLYTARDDDTGYDYYSDYSEPNSEFNYTDRAISLKSVPGCIDLSVSSPIKTFTVGDNNSLTALSPTISTISKGSLIVELHPPPPPPTAPSLQNTISVRRGSRAVSYLARKFEERLSRRQKGHLEEEPKTSSPLEILFPPLPKIYKKEEEEEADETLKASEVVTVE